MQSTVFIVDDAVAIARGLSRLLEDEGYQVYSAHSGKEARGMIDDICPDVVLMDFHLPDADGVELMEAFKPKHPGAQFIIITAHGSIKHALESSRRGASDYLTKPFEREEVLHAVSNAMQLRRMEEELNRLRSIEYPNSEIIKSKVEDISESKAMLATSHMLRLATKQDGIVLLLGESGVGKDYWARWIHNNSKRASGPFFSINCAALTRELAESELFGHEPGAFTGTRGRKRGLVELAENGTLLLNEVGELEPPLQAKLLSFLDNKSFVRVGGEKTVKIDARIIAATNANLEESVERGTFRRDLYYRLNVLGIRLPSLEERIEDLPGLVSDVLERLGAELGLTTRPSVDPAAMKRLEAYNWPGNIRELHNVLERALIVSTDNIIHEEELSLKAAQTLEPWGVQVRFPKKETLHDVIKEVSREIVTEALRRGATKQEAAELLGISRHALAHQIKALDIEA